ncbi:MAG: biopolymer transporter ExbD [Candidatus Omnitrophica bacterium]|nr:biopolymer transporter ExbD [Candidatus Omnitrophota bacterium]
MEFVRSKRSALTIDMAPLVDIVFQLLIFFMLSSSFLAPAIKMNLPEAVTKDTTNPDRVVISIDREDRLYVNKEETDWQSLKDRVKVLLNHSKSVDIRADEQVSYKRFVQAMDTVRQAGAIQVNIVHEKK